MYQRLIIFQFIIFPEVDIVHTYPGQIGTTVIQILFVDDIRMAVTLP